MLLINLWVVLSTLQEGWSPLMIASQHGHHQIARVLIKQGANLNCQSKVNVSIVSILNKVATYMD